MNRGDSQRIVEDLFRQVHLWTCRCMQTTAKRSQNRRFWPSRSAKTTPKSGSISAGEPHTFYTSLSYILGYCAYLNSGRRHKGSKNARDPNPRLHLHGMYHKSCMPARESYNTLYDSLMPAIQTTTCGCLRSPLLQY